MSLEVLALKKRIETAFPGIQVSVTKPEVEDGHWFLDVEHGGKHVFVQWTRRTGWFGISTHEERMDVAVPDVISSTVEQAAHLIAQMLAGQHPSGRGPETPSEKLPKYTLTVGHGSFTTNQVNAYVPHLPVPDGPYELEFTNTVQYEGRYTVLWTWKLVEKAEVPW